LSITEELGLETCPKCGAMHKPGEHSPESCGFLQKANAMKRSMIEAGLWNSNDVAAIEEHLRKFEH
jgi:hypothetical protein